MPPTGRSDSPRGGAALLRQRVFGREYAAVLGKAADVAANSARKAATKV
jgi:hypothetical protein